LYFVSFHWEQGWHSGESVPRGSFLSELYSSSVFPFFWYKQMLLLLLLVLALLHVFLSRISGFLPSTTLLNCNSIWKQWTKSLSMGCATANSYLLIYLFIYLFIYIFIYLFTYLFIYLFTYLF